MTRTVLLSAMLYALTISSISGQSIDIDTDSITLVDNFDQNRAILFTRENKTMLRFPKYDFGVQLGFGLAEIGTDDKGNFGTLALTNKNGLNEIYAEVGRDEDAGYPWLVINGDSSLLWLNSPFNTGDLRLFVNGDQSGLKVIGEDLDFPLAEFGTNPSGMFGTFSLRNLSGTKEIYADVGAVGEQGLPILTISGDTSLLRMVGFSESGDMRLFIKGKQAGLKIVDNNINLPIAEIRSNAQGEFGQVSVRSANKIDQITITGGHNGLGSEIFMEGDTSIFTMRSFDMEGNIELSLLNDSTSFTMTNGKIDLVNEFAFSYLEMGSNVQGGKIELFSNNVNKSKIELTTGDDGTYGSLRLLGQNSEENVLATTSIVSSDLGYLGIYNEDPLIKVGMYATLEGNGEIEIWGDNGFNNIYLANSGADANRGYLHVANSSGVGRAGALITSDQKGLVFSENFQLLNTSNAVVASMSINGSGNSEVSAHTISATVKNFKIDHPSQKGKEIWFACIEGPEVAAYARGTATLINGEVTVELAHYFSEIVEAQGITVLLTPMSADSKGLSVTSKGVQQFSVKELSNGVGNYSFDWEVKAVRVGFTNYKVVRDKPNKEKKRSIELNDLLTSNSKHNYQQKK